MESSHILPVCRGVYLAAVFYHKDSLLVTTEDQIPIVEVDDSYSSSLMQDFLWFTKVTALRRQNEGNIFFIFKKMYLCFYCTVVVHVGGRSVAQAEHASVHVVVLHPAGPAQDANGRQPDAGQKDKKLSFHFIFFIIGETTLQQRSASAAGPSLLCKPLQTGSDSAAPPPSPASTLQSLLGTHNLGRVHYEPIKDRHGNVLLVTIRDLDSQHSLYSGKWMQVTKLQSQRKSLSTPEEPYALDILIITIQVGRGAKSPVYELFSIHISIVKAVGF